MSLAALPGLLAGEPALAALLGADDAVVAVPEAAEALVLAAVAGLGAAPVVVVCTPTGSEAERLAHDLAAFSDVAVYHFPAWETLPFERVSPAVETMGRRLEALVAIGRRSLRGEKTVVVAPVKALLQRLCEDAAALDPVTVALGDSPGLDALIERLVDVGYRREYQVEHRGEFAVRGGIVDVYPSTGRDAVRIDLFGDEVERLTAFDVGDQRSVRDLDRVEIQGCRELLATQAVRARAAELVATAPFGRDRFAALAEGAVFDGMESFLPWVVPEIHLLTDLLEPADRVVLVEPRRCRDRARELLEEEAALADALATTWGVEAGEELPRLHAEFARLLERCPAHLSSLVPVAEGPGTTVLPASGWAAPLGDQGAVVRRLGALAGDGYRVVVCAEGHGSAERMVAALRADGVVATLLADPSGEGAERLRSPGVHVVEQPLERGAVLSGSRLAIVSESDLTGRRRAHRPARPRARPTEGFFDDLAPGDFVVHHVHGVARYGGMVSRSIGGAERDYLSLEYRGGDRLYVPSDQIDAITPYSGGEHPSLNRLGGAEWSRQKAKVRAGVREVARELVVLYRARAEAPGRAFPPDTPWQRELEDAFPFVETPDQLRAIAEVKADMERPVPMDRLVCGDVGFGKTEVAVRAVFKAVQDGCQAAVLVPTTILAQQHYQTFSERYSPYPVRVEMLSRFLSPAAARGVINGLADGSVDVVIGTHQLLGSDVTFRDLGLLVVDEEQRFGVSHKETMKKLRVGVDVLTLTASPIPRTLELSLTGIRDLSLITTPPVERQPILTYVGEYDQRAVSEALRRELLREGQAFFVHNRVQDIDRVTYELSALVPEARIAVAHGQMDEGSLEQVVLDFSEGRYDVLVCTTIIESGIDMPAVNTLVVDRADLLGLGQLHQLRGRVGRAGQRAYAYLLYPPERVLTEQAYERLRTIGEHTELGSGFKIAMRDLEIRGAGNLLGTDQSGHIAAVGYDLYVRMVAEAVAELKGEPVPQPAEIKLDVPVDAYLPAEYVAAEDLRLEAYRRLAAVRTAEEVEAIAEEWRDRFGPLPVPAAALLSVARLRAACVRGGVREVTVVRARPGDLVGGRGDVVARLSPIELRASSRVRLTRLFPKALFKEDLRQLILPLPGRPSLADDLATLLDDLLPARAPAPVSA